MASLNDFLPQLGTQDTKKKLQVGSDIISYLEHAANELDCEDLGAFIDNLVTWLNSSNFKVALNGLEILIQFVNRLGEDFRPYVSTVLQSTVDRLGDNKDQVRDEAQVLIQKLMSLVVTPQAIFDKIPSAFSHKNGRVRQEIMVTLQKILQQQGSQAIALSKLVPYIVKLLGDPTAPVRDEAVNTLIEIYRHVGERVRIDLAKKYSIPPAKLQAILAKFDDVKHSGQLKATAIISGSSSTTSSLDGGCRGDDEPDRAISLLKSSAAKRASSAPPVRRAIFTAPQKPISTVTSTPSSATTVQRKKSFRNVPNPAGQAGAVDEETFIKSFEDVPKVEFFSVRDLEVQLQQSREILADEKNDWGKRIDALKKVRSLLLAGAANYDEFYPNLKLLVPAFQVSVKDLRSQVAREACITIAYLSQQLGHRMDHVAEMLLTYLINLIPNSAKVMATAGFVAVRFVIRYTHATRLIPIITSNMTTKSKDIRKACCEFLDQLLHTWPTHTLERHIATLQDAIKKGISDADSEARASSRKAFWGFHDHFKEQADSLLASLEVSKQKMLQGECSISSSSSNNSLQNSVGRISRSRASSAAGSTENLSRLPSYGMRRSGIPVLSGGRTEPDTFLYNGSHISSPFRSNSAIDVHAAQRAKARQAYAAAARLKIGSVASLPRPARKVKEPVGSAITSPERSGRSKTRVGVSQSQPSSRSGSPSSRLSYATYNMHGADAAARGRRKSGSTVRSTGASRETSPNRHLFGGHERRLSGGQKRTRPYGGIADRSFGLDRSFGATGSSPVHLSKTPHVMAQRILLQSQEAEAAMADALKVSSRPHFDTYGNESDDSETSSVCSERSYGSLGRGVGSLNWHSSLPRLWSNGWDPVGQDVSEVIQNLSSQHWSDRKEGLCGLQILLQGNRLLSQAELKRVTEIFTKMFMDPHTKVFSFFLDTLNELIVTHKADLHEWLYILVTRLLHKQGMDLLGSVLAKLQRSLEVVRESFPCNQQFQILIRFLTDQTQTPNLKVKLATLSYLQTLSQFLDGSDLRASPECTTAFTKILTWASDPKSADLRKASQSVLFAYFGLNTPEFTKLLNQLPRTLQDSAFKLLKNMMKSPPSPVTARLHSPNIVSRHRFNLSNVDPDDTENINPEDIYVSLRETSAEIQNYSFDGLDNSFTKERRELDRDTTSQDSGISQMSVPDGRMDVLEEKYESSPEENSPSCRREYNATLYQDQVPQNGFGNHKMSESFIWGDKGLEEELSNVVIGDMEDVLAAIADVGKSMEERTYALIQLASQAKRGSIEAWDNHFRLVLRTLLDTFEDADASVRAKSLVTLCEVLRHQSSRFHGFTELTILKVLDAHKDPDKDVVRAVEQCAHVLASVLTVEQSVRVINPVILTGEFPVNLAAIKMLTKVVDQRPLDEVTSMLTTVMPGLLKAYNDPESSVRKAAVFCIVALHTINGEAMKPYLAELNGSKMKLLNVYIKRAQSVQTNSQASSSPGSPKNSPYTKPH